MGRPSHVSAPIPSYKDVPVLTLCIKPVALLPKVEPLTLTHLAPVVDVKVALVALREKLVVANAGGRKREWDITSVGRTTRT